MGPLGTNGNGGRLYVCGGCTWSTSQPWSLQIQPSINTTGKALVKGNFSMLSGKGVGDAGAFYLSSSADQAMLIAGGAGTQNGTEQVIQISPGLISGKGADIAIVNSSIWWQSSGNNTVPPLMTINQSFDVSGRNAAGGNISISTGNRGTIDFISGTGINANATGFGKFNGGNIYVSAYYLSNNSSNNLLFSANGSGTGNGGTIQVVGMWSSPQVGLLAGQMSFQAKSGSFGGNGGSLSVGYNWFWNSGDLGIVDANAIDVSVLASGNGGTIVLGGVTGLTGTLNVSGRGAAGNGGNVTITGISTSQVLSIAGDIIANGSGSGKAGQIQLNPFLYSLAPAVISVSGNLSASGASGLGNIILGMGVSNGDLIVSAQGTMVGKLTGATNHNINIQANGGTLTLQNIYSSGGSVSVTNIGSNGAIYVPLGGVVRAVSDITLSAKTVGIDGTVTSSGGQISLGAANSTIYGNGNIYFSGGSANVISFAKGSVIHGNLLVDTGNGASFFGDGRLGGTNISELSSAAALAGTLAGSRTLISSSSVTSTDSVPRSVSLGSSKDDNSSGLVKVGDKFIVTNSNLNLSMFVASDNSIEMAEAGSEVSEEDGEVYLSKGKIVLSTSDKESRSVRTPQGRITIGQSSAAVVKVAVTGTVSVTSMEGTKVLYQGKTESSAIEVNRGEELIANSDGLEDEELIPVDGIERGDAITMSLTRVSKKVVKRTVSLTQLIEKDVMINGSLIHIKGARKKTQADYAARIRDAAQAQESSALKPIAYQTFSEANAPMINGAGNSLAMQTIAPLRFNKSLIPSGETARLVLRQSTDAHCQMLGKLLLLDRGELLVRAERDELLISNGIIVKLPAGSVALLTRRTNLLSIRGIYDRPGQSVRVHIGKESVSVPPGAEVLISKTDSDIKNAIAKEGIGRRRLKMSKVSNGGSIASSEYSLVSVVKNSLPLSDFLASTNKEEVRLVGKIKKLYAALTMVTMSHGPYSDRQ